MCPWDRMAINCAIRWTKPINALGDRLKEYGELLELSCPDASLSLFNPTSMVDALDENACSLKRFANGRIMMIQKYAFRAEAVHGVEIFKIPNLRVSPTFVGHGFVEQWKRAGLKGLDFKKIWAPAPK